MKQFNNPETRVMVTHIRAAFDSIFPDCPDLWEQFEDRLHTAWLDGFDDSAVRLASMQQAQMPEPEPEPIPDPVPAEDEINLYFPKIVEMLLKKNIRLHLLGSVRRVGSLPTKPARLYSLTNYGILKTMGKKRPNASDSSLVIVVFVGEH
jgi:hypothetical protein